MEKGVIKRVTNLNPRFGASDTYNVVNCSYEDQNITYFFTDSQLRDAQIRAENNAEDIDEIVYSDTRSIKYTFAVLFGMIVGLIISSFI